MEKREKTGRVISGATLDRYLAAILGLRRRLAIVRSVDVASYLGYSKACVCVAVKQMIQEELVLVERHGALVLSPEGERRARAHLERCDYFRGLLLESGVEVGLMETVHPASGGLVIWETVPQSLHPPPPWAGVGVVSGCVSVSWVEWVTWIAPPCWRL